MHAEDAMDSVSPSSGLLVAKAMAAQDAIADRFARETSSGGEGKAVLNATFQMLGAAQDNLDAIKEASLPEGTGGRVDVKA
jgi:hypothetical protein